LHPVSKRERVKKYSSMVRKPKVRSSQSVPDVSEVVTLPSITKPASAPSTPLQQMERDYTENQKVIEDIRRLYKNM
jgi:hypothetical protein